MKIPIYKTKKKAVAICGFENKDIQEAVKGIGKCLQNEPDNWIVLRLVLQEGMKLNTKKYKWIRFDFGGKKEFELKRLK